MSDKTQTDTRNHRQWSNLRFAPALNEPLRNNKLWQRQKKIGKIRGAAGRAGSAIAPTMWKRLLVNTLMGEGPNIGGGGYPLPSYQRSARFSLMVGTVPHAPVPTPVWKKCIFTDLPPTPEKTITNGISNFFLFRLMMNIEFTRTQGNLLRCSVMFTFPICLPFSPKLTALSQSNWLISILVLPWEAAALVYFG